MTAKIKFGQGLSSSLDLDEASLTARFRGPEGKPLGDLAAAVAAALADPIGFPPLGKAIVPGDQIALTVDPSLPQAPLIVSVVVDALLQAGITPPAITIVRGEFDPRDYREALSPAAQDEIVITTHDPSCRDDLAYLAADGDGKPVFVNRAIADADFALPIGMLRARGVYDYHGMHSCWFPEFSDLETQQRYRAPSSVESPVQRRRRRDEANQSAWLVGMLMTLQVIPADGDQPLHVLAGSLPSVAEQGHELCDAAWTLSIEQTATLVVATITGDSSQQTWSNVARALATATALVDDGGTIVICCDLSSPPGDVMHHITEHDDLESEGLDAAAREIRRHRDRDAAMAGQLVRTLRSAKVYLLSSLKQPVVESMGVVYVADTDEIVRLTQHHASCILLDNAHLAVPYSPSAEDDEFEDDFYDDDEDDNEDVEGDNSDDDNISFDELLENDFNSPADE